MFSIIHSNQKCAEIVLLINFYEQWEETTKWI